MTHGTAKTEQTEKPPSYLSVNINNAMYTLAEKSGQEKAKLITDKKANFPIGSEISFRGQGSLRPSLKDQHTVGGGHCRKMLKAIWQAPLELKLHPLPPKKHKPWRVTGMFCSSRRNKKRHLYEFACYFSEVTTGQLLFCKLAQNSFLKGGA